MSEAIYTFEEYLKGVSSGNIMKSGEDGLGDGVLIHITNLIDPVSWGQLFRNEAPVELDLGCGDGGFLLEYASRNKGRNLLGTERLMGRVNKIVRQAKRRSLQNVHVSRIESGYFLHYLVPPQSLTAVHLYFPDPWPKKKHEKYRLVTPQFAKDCLAALKPGGTVYLRTDNVPYYEQMLEVFDPAEGFEKVETPAELAEIQTDFEKYWLSLGLQTNYVAYQKK